LRLVQNLAVFPTRFTKSHFECWIKFILLSS